MAKSEHGSWWPLGALLAVCAVLAWLNWGVRTHHPASSPVVAAAGPATVTYHLTLPPPPTPRAAVPAAPLAVPLAAPPAVPVVPPPAHPSATPPSGNAGGSAPAPPSALPAPTQVTITGPGAAHIPALVVSAGQRPLVTLPAIHLPAAATTASVPTTALPAPPVTAATTASAASAPPAAPVVSTCSDVSAFAVPGTFETSATADPVPVGVLGKVTGALTHDYPTSRLHVAYIAYPATILDPLYPDSEAKGVANLTAAIASTVRDCPRTHVMLFGFSQGAAVAGDVATQIAQGNGPTTADRVIGVGLIADPSRAPNAPTLPTGVGGQGVLGARPAGFGALAGRVAEICAPGDPVCAAPATGITWQQLDQAVRSQIHTDAAYEALRVTSTQTTVDWLVAAAHSSIDMTPVTSAPPTATPTARAPSTTPPVSSPAAPVAPMTVHVVIPDWLDITVTGMPDGHGGWTLTRVQGTISGTPFTGLADGRMTVSSSGPPDVQVSITGTTLR